MSEPNEEVEKINTDIDAAIALLEDYRLQTADFLDLAKDFFVLAEENQMQRTFIEKFQTDDVVVALTDTIVKPIGLWAKGVYEENVRLKANISAYGEYAEDTSQRQADRIAELEREVEVQRIRADEAQDNVVKLNEEVKKLVDYYGEVPEDDDTPKSAWESSSCWASSSQYC